LTINLTQAREFMSTFNHIFHGYWNKNLHVKGELINMTRERDKEKNLSPRKESNPLSPKHMTALYPLSYENSWRASSFNWVHIWQASCILLGSALLKSSWVVMSEKRRWHKFFIIHFLLAMFAPLAILEFFAHLSQTFAQ